MRMVGNMSSSVDYRVITIIDAPGKREGHTKEIRPTERKRTEIYNNPTQGKRRKSREKREHIQLAEIMAL